MRELAALNVLPAYWGHGIGRALVTACVDSAALAGSLRLELRVLSENHRAKRLYEACGFRATGGELITTNLTGYPLHELCYSHGLNR